MIHMPRRELTRGEIEAFQRQAVEATEKLFIDQGLSGVTMQAVTQQLGCWIFAKMAEMIHTVSAPNKKEGTSCDRTSSVPHDDDGSWQLAVAHNAPSLVIALAFLVASIAMLLKMRQQRPPSFPQAQQTLQKELRALEKALEETKEAKGNIPVQIGRCLASIKMYGSIQSSHRKNNSDSQGES